MLKLSDNIMSLGLVLVFSFQLPYLSGCESKSNEKVVVGKKKTAVCRSCHGEYGDAVDPIPKLAGQNKQYLLGAMKAYADGRRDHPSMKSFVAGLNEQDLEDIATFYSKNRAR